MCCATAVPITSNAHGVDIATIALWLGHEHIPTTHGVYLHAALGLKEKALALAAPPKARRGRYRPPDKHLGGS
jgi:integrase